MDAVPWRALRSARRLGGFPTCYCLTNSHAELYALLGVWGDFLPVIVSQI